MSLLPHQFFKREKLGMELIFLHLWPSPSRDGFFFVFWGFFF